MQGRSTHGYIRSGLRRLLDLVVLLLGTITLLFFLLRLTGDPAIVLAGPDASPDQIAAISQAYGFDRSLVVQYGRYIGNVARLDFGASLVDDTPALAKVLDALPATVLLGSLAMALTLLISLPTGLWLGSTSRPAAARALRVPLFILQGFPGFVTALLLVQLFAIQLAWLPALGASGLTSWILPATAVASFLSPKLIRLVEANTAAVMPASYIRTARANGVPDDEILWRHVAPNALLGAVALIGAQFASLVTGLVIIEAIFAWPGIGWLLVQSTVNLDFPVVQAITFTIVIAVFIVNTVTDLVQRRLDPRIGAAG
jgi:ABC-type dipeptide/oligopeptide/nickel transport system permease component